LISAALVLKQSGTDDAFNPAEWQAMHLPDRYIASETGKQLLNDTIARLGESVVGQPIVIEGYSNAADPGNHLASSYHRAILVRQYSPLCEAHKDHEITDLLIYRTNSMRLEERPQTLCPELNLVNSLAQAYADVASACFKEAAAQILGNTRKSDFLWVILWVM
jgi:hypothetical protein